MTDEEKLYQAYYQPHHLWTGNRAIKELPKTMSMSKKDIKSWLVKQAIWQVYRLPPKEINHPHYDMTEPNEQHQFHILYMSHNLFEGNTYKYILTGIDAAPRYKVARPLRTKKSSEVAFVLEAIYKKGSVYVIMVQNLKMKWQSCLKNTALRFEEQQQNISILTRPLWKPLTEN